MKKQNIIDVVEIIDVQMEKAMAISDEIREGFLDGVMPKWDDPKEREDHSYKLLLSFQRYSNFANIMMDYMYGVQGNITELLESLGSEEVEVDEVKESHPAMELLKLYDKVSVEKANLDKSAVTTVVKQRLGDVYSFLNDIVTGEKYDVDFTYEMGQIFDGVEQVIVGLNKLDEVAV